MLQGPQMVRADFQTTAVGGDRLFLLMGSLPDKPCVIRGQMTLQPLRTPCFELLLQRLEIPCKSIAMQATLHIQDLLQETDAQGDRFLP